MAAWISGTPHDVFEEVGSAADFATTFANVAGAAADTVKSCADSTGPAKPIRDGKSEGIFLLESCFS